MIKKAVLCILLLSSSVGIHAEAPYLTGLYEPVDGGYLLSFTVHNALEDAVVWGLGIATADAFDPIGPPGWSIMHNFREVAWTADNASYRIPAGESLGGFRYTATNQPTMLGYWITGGGAHFGEVTMVLIPEPGSLLALGGGLAALGIPWLRRRRRR